MPPYRLDIRQVGSELEFRSIKVKTWIMAKVAIRHERGGGHRSTFLKELVRTFGTQVGGVVLVDPLSYEYLSGVFDRSEPRS
jgi:hypothetical protein